MVRDEKIENSSLGKGPEQPEDTEPKGGEGCVRTALIIIGTVIAVIIVVLF